MSLWTPDGEHHISGDPTAGDDATAPLSFEDLSPEQQEQARAMAREMAEAQDRILGTPAADIVANHAMGLYELAALHLSQDPPGFAEASVAIDAMTAVVERLPGRLGENEPTLRQALGQLQMAFVQLRSATQGGPESPDASDDDPEASPDAGSDGPDTDGQGRVDPVDEGPTGPGDED